jgi:HD-GYP domain-containing protein (c-di-GMP phosphodiesterase class II)
MSTEDALAEIKRCSGSQFDPAVVDAFLALVGAEEKPAQFKPSIAVPH